MELWIRSQDKEVLLKVNELEIEANMIIAFDNNKYQCLGTYETKERTLEILDEIQNKINLINLGHDFGSPMIDLKNPTYIYQMPEK